MHLRTWTSSSADWIASKQRKSLGRAVLVSNNHRHCKCTFSSLTDYKAGGMDLFRHCHRTEDIWGWSFFLPQSFLSSFSFFQSLASCFICKYCSMWQLFYYCILITLKIAQVVVKFIQQILLSIICKQHIARCWKSVTVFICFIYMVNVCFCLYN